MDQDFIQELIEIFKSEAEDYLNILSSGLLKLEEGANPDVLEQVYRTTHSLKGAARAVNYSGIEEICQVMETIFSRLKNGEMEMSPELMDVLMAGVDQLNEIINSEELDQDADFEVLENLRKALNGELPSSGKKTEKAEKAAEAPEEKKAKSEEAAQTPAAEEGASKSAKKSVIKERKPAKPKPEKKSKESGKKANNEPSLRSSAKSQSETIRVSFNRIDQLMNQSEELLMIKLKNDHYVQNIQSLNDNLKIIKNTWVDFLNHMQQTISNCKQSSGAASRNIQQLNDLITLFINKMQSMDSYEKQLLQFYGTVEKDNYQISTLIEHHLTDVRQLMMFPFSTITNYLQTSTRSIARELNKQIELKIVGSEIELDKHVLEALKDPLIHLIRNSIDHGIETPEKRVMKGKPEKGNITIEVLPPREQNIVIRISDDGSGIDLEKVKQSAIRKKLVTPEEIGSLNDAQVLALIFKSGFSTKEEVSRLSGRGLGMAVVAENIEKLGGTITIENNPPYGCSFLITLPLNIATSRGILIETAGQRFIIPTRVVEAPLRVSADQLKSVENRKVINLNGRNIPVFELAALLNLKVKTIEKEEKLNVLILNWADKRLALIVDRIIDEREILLKRLNPPLEEVRFLAGATILGDGSLVPVLNSSDLFQTGSTQIEALPTEKKMQKKRILVVEDSITSRVLLKNVLEGAGYEVQTAINGVRAWDLLQKEPFDLIVSDVEMPELDGLGLTRKVRKDDKLKSMPLILLTSRGSKEDRKKGMEAGANAYFIKSSFEQKSLLDLIAKLI